MKREDFERIFPYAPNENIKTTDELADIVLKKTAETVGHPKWYSLSKNAAKPSTRKKWRGVLEKQFRSISLAALAERKKEE